ncbi:MAG TPA: methyltransferase domain-containing protein [Gemmatimonadaceae bacterium]|nr:methyltransferase domain-containing protein [Gemmatimonadaceae bacterium]
MTTPPDDNRVPPAPAVLRLVQMAVMGRWRATGEELYREVASLVEAAPGREIFVSGCGDGVTTEWLAVRTGATVTGVDSDPERIDRAEQRAREAARGSTLSYQAGRLDDLPFENEVFDAAVGEPAVAALDDPSRAIAELVRVTRPMGLIVLLQPTWSADIRGAAREMLVERLGLRPRLLVEWKQMLREAGVVELQVQDWTSGGPVRGGPQPDAELTWQQKVQIVGRAWRRRGWREARGAIEREKTLLRELSRERAIGFQLLKGVKWPHAREG